MTASGLQSDILDATQGLDGLSARALLLSMRRHVALVAFCTLLFCVLGAVVGLGLPDWYQAESVLVIKAKQPRIADVQELPDPAPDLLVIRSEVDILQSRSVIEPVVKSLELWRLPEFQKQDYPRGWSWKNLETHLRDLVGIDSSTDAHAVEPSSLTPENSPPTQAEIDAAIEQYARYLGVGNDGRSMTIRIVYRAWTPERAAEIVNAHLDSYQNLQEQAKLKAASRANSALTAQIAELRKQLQAAEAAVTRYREQHNLMGAAKDSGALSTQLANLNNQLIAARADLAENEARAARIGAAAQGKGADSVPEVIASGTMSVLRGQEAQLIQREADLSKYHGDAYPELQRVRASLQNLRAQISREIGRSHGAALQLVERSRTRERSIQQSILELTKQINSADAGLQQLQSNAESIRGLLRDFEKRAEESAASPAFIIPNATIASRANPSAAVTSSKAPVLSFVGGFVGLTLGSLLSVLFELRDKTFRTSTQVEQQIGSLRVGATPRAGRLARKSPADVILDDHDSVFAESFRLSWANIQLALDGPKSASFPAMRSGIAIGITSASSGEGKSTHALAFARTAALAGEKVVLVDADLRRSGVSRLLKQSFCFTLRDFLEGRCTADEVLAAEARSGVHFVPSTPVKNSWTRQDIQSFVQLVGYLKERYAVVIIDLPPVLGLAETIRLSTVADCVTLVIRWGRTERPFVQFALDALRSAGVSATAAILNDIDLKAQQRRGYRDRTAVYTVDGLYRTAQGARRPAPRPMPPARAYVKSDDRHELDASTQTPDPRRSRSEVREGSHENATRAGSDIERLYTRYHS
jgi:succinoglycan biosynthesis transport protein ExoP